MRTAQTPRLADSAVPVVESAFEPAFEQIPDRLLPKAAGATLAEQLALRYAQRIDQRLLAAGARLPSVREAARRHRVSPSTVVVAYDLLQAQGLVQARPQRGFFVRGEAAAPPAGRSGQLQDAAAAFTAQPQQTPRPAAPADATALIRSMFQSQGRPPGPGMGMLPEDWLDGPLLQRALRQVLGRANDAGAWLRYGDPAGDPLLRAALSRRLADLGIAAAPAQIVTTVGATQALDLVARTLLRPGDAVLVDEPGWAVEFARLALAGLRVLPVPRGPDGPDLAVLEALLVAHRPRLYVTVSVLHNPTGNSLTPAAAHRLLRLAEQHDLTIAEDDTYAWLAPPHATRLSQLDGLQRTLCISGFSKILAPQWRVGFVAASPALVERLTDTKLLGTLTTAAPLEQAVAHCLDQGALRRHAERVVQRLAAARASTTQLALQAGCHFAAPPHGLFGWVDVSTDTDALAQALLDEGWLIAPGSLFHVVPRPTSLMRVNFATARDPRFWQRLAALRDARQRGGSGRNDIPTKVEELSPQAANRHS